MKEKQLIERALPFAHTFTFRGIHRGRLLDGDTVPCDNCGAILSTWAEVFEHETRNVRRVGTDCADTLAKAGALRDGARMYQIDKAAYNGCARFITEVRKGKPWIVVGMFATIENDNGRPCRVFVEDLRLYFPEVANTHATTA